VKSYVDNVNTSRTPEEGAHSPSSPNGLYYHLHYHHLRKKQENDSDKSESESKQSDAVLHICDARVACTAAPVTHLSRIVTHLSHLSSTGMGGCPYPPPCATAVRKRGTTNHNNTSREFPKTAYVIPPTRGRTGGVAFRIDFRISGCWRTAWSLSPSLTRQEVGGLRTRTTLETIYTRRRCY
jgi:hypothetical protein